MTTYQSANLVLQDEVKRGNTNAAPQAPLHCGGEAPAPRPELFTFRSTSHFLRSVLAAALFATTATVAAQTFPERPIRMVVGFPPGGGVDLAARIVAEGMSKALGQTIVVENRSGAAGGIGAAAVAQAAPDGYTILMGNTGSLTINKFLYSDQTVDTMRDFEPVALVSTAPLAIVAHPSVPAKNLSELVEMARKEPGKYTFGTGGAGSISHLAMELLKMQTKTDLLHVPYRGGSPAVQDLMAGQLDVVVEGVPLTAPLILDGRIRGLAVTSPERSDVLPDVPAAKESGFPDFVVTAWYGIVAPKGTPKEVIEALNRAANTALQDPALQERFAQQGSSVAGGSPAEFGDHLRGELSRWEGAVKAADLRLQ